MKKSRNSISSKENFEGQIKENKYFLKSKKTQPKPN